MLRCTLCRKTFLKCNIFIFHLKVQHPLQQNYLCGYQYCLRKFSNVFSLKKHMNSSNHLVVASNHIKTRNVCVDSDLSNRSNVSQNDKDDNAAISDFDEINTKDIPVQLTDTDLTRCLLKFIGTLYCNPSITRNLVQEIISHSSELIDDILNYIKIELTKALDSNLHGIIQPIFNFSVFENFKTEYKRFKYMESEKYLIQPKSVVIGEMPDSRRNPENTIIMSSRKCEAQVIPMRKCLKNFLELPGVFTVIQSFIVSESNKDQELSSIFCGSLWKNLQHTFGEKIVLPILLYYDDFESNNPLGSKAGIHKIGALYYTIAGIPPSFSSTLNNIFLCQLMYSSDRSMFGNRKAFNSLLEELQFLESNGVTLQLPEGNLRVYFCLFAVLGDNLGLNSLLGFTESFSSHYFCRKCRSSKAETQVAIFENYSTLRNQQNYKLDVVNKEFGVQGSCIFNSLKNYHNVENITFDLMHDIYEGICRYDMAKIIKQLISKKYISLNCLNHRLKYFQYNSNVDIGNPIPAISDHHLTKGCLIMSASEIAALVTYFGIIIGDKIPEGDEHWRLYLLLYDIVDIITSPAITTSNLSLLKCLIAEHNSLYQELFQEGLKPKYHFLVHYPSTMLCVGPLKHLSSIRYEAMHKLSKVNAHIVNSRINLPYTLSLKLQLRLAYRLLSNKGIENSFETGKFLGTLQNYNLNDAFPTDCISDLYVVSWAKINGIFYKIGYAFHDKTNDVSEPIFGVIRNVVTDWSGSVYIVYDSCVTVGFNSHMAAFEIEISTKQNRKRIIKLNPQHLIIPRSIHIGIDGTHMIAKIIQ
jgi:hypothetical protein